MKSLVFGGLVLGMGLVTARGEAQQLEVAARLGYQLPTGQVAEVPPDVADADALDMDEIVTGEIPIGFEIGIRVVPRFALNAYFDLAPGIVASDMSDTCDAFDHDCSIAGFHVGLMGHLHIAPEAAVDPWFGAGLGAEGLSLAESDGQSTATLSFTGIEFPLRFGVDFKLAERFALGPYVGYTFGTFSTATLKCEGPRCAFPDAEEDIEQTASHGWAGFGAKLTILAL